MYLYKKKHTKNFLTDLQNNLREIEKRNNDKD